jgi:multidrug efflux pump subunit AcrA (membrane-fusion protein)
VRLAFAKPTRYPVGAPVQVAIETDTHKNVVLVPASAIVREGEETAVFAVENQTAKRREVKTGIESGDRVEIVSGINTGEMVITSGQNGLPDGAKVTLAARGEK